MIPSQETGEALTNQGVAPTAVWSKMGRLRYGRQLHEFGARIGLPNPVRNRLIKTIKLTLYPREFVRRRNMARRLVARTPPPVRVPQDSAFLQIGPDAFPGQREVVEICQRIYRDQSPKYDLEDPNNRFRIDLLTRPILLRHLEIVHFATSPEVVATVADYFGCVPNLTMVQLWWTPPNQTTTGSQLFHVDQVDYRQLKIFLNISNVTHHGGPLCFLPAHITKKVLPKLKRPFDRVNDDEIFRYCHPDDMVALTGGEGSGGIVDTCRCYHFGGRTRKASRVVLMLQYVPYHCMREVCDIGWYELASRGLVKPHRNYSWLTALLDLPPHPWETRQQSAESNEREHSL